MIQPVYAKYTISAFLYYDFHADKNKIYNNHSIHRQYKIVLMKKKKTFTLSLLKTLSS